MKMSRPSSISSLEPSPQPRTTLRGSGALQAEPEESMLEAQTFDALHRARRIDDGEGWMAMIKARNLSSHTYNLEQANAIAHDVIDRFAPLFDALRVRFAALSESRP